MKLIYKDDALHTTDYSALTYELVSNGVQLYEGYAEDIDGNGITIYLNRLAEQFMNATPLSGNTDGFVTGVTTDPGAYRSFILSGPGEPLKWATYLYGFGGEINDLVIHQGLSNPINGKMDPRMYLFFTRCGDVSGEVEIEVL